MRITFLAPHINIAGGTRALLKYSDLLASFGHDVEIRIPERRWLHRGVKSLQAAGADRPAWEPTRASIRYVPDLSPRFLGSSDVTIATAWRTADALAKGDARVGARWYLVQHYESLYHGDPETVDATYRLGHRTIVISHWLEEIMREKFGIKATTLVTPVDKRVFRPRPISRSDDFRVCMMHHSSEWKDVAAGLRAIERFREAGGSCKLVVFGAVRDAEFEAKADEAYWGKSGDELATIYSSCDVYLCTSRFEGLGMPPMEAMACGCALVTTDTGGGRSYAENCRTALVADQGDDVALAKHLRALADDRRFLEAIRDAGRSKIAEFDWEKSARAFETALLESRSSDARSAYRSSSASR